MERRPKLVCVGHMVREMIHFPDRVAGPFLGSPPAYCSVAAACQGVLTGVVTKIGPDMPESLLQPLTDAEVDTRGIMRCLRTTASELIYSAGGNKEIRYTTKAEPIVAEDIPPEFRGCDMIYVCTMDNDVLPGDLASVASQGKMSAVDLGGYGGVHMSLENRKAVDSLEHLAREVSRHFDIVKASDEDAASIFGWDDPEEAAIALSHAGTRVVLITLGAEGILVCTEEGLQQVPAMPARVIDTTGGGDTFMAGFLAEFLRSEDVLKATRWGCATAACMIEHTGGVRVKRMPTRQQVQRRLELVYHV